MINAGVMIAKVIWNSIKRDSGISPATASRPMPDSITLLKSPIKGASFAKSQAVPDDEPQDRGDAGNRKTLHQNREHVLGAHQTAVKERQPGQRHEQHQGG